MWPLSGGVVVFVVQVVVQRDDGADELAQLHEVGRDDVDAVLAGPLGANPLHHARQGPGVRGSGGQVRQVIDRWTDMDIPPNISFNRSARKKNANSTGKSCVFLFEGGAYFITGCERDWTPAPTGELI